MARQYVIMAGGVYENFDRPKALIEFRGETLAARTVRLLKDAGVKLENIHFTGDDARLKEYGADLLVHDNPMRWENGKRYGYWLDAFYPNFADDVRVTYLYGDVVYTPGAIKTIVNCNRAGNILFGTGLAKNKLHKNWGEAFAYQVDDYKTFMAGIDAVKKLWDDGKLNRHPITWQLYRYLNGLDVNVQTVRDETYICIDDGTIDIDKPEMIAKVEKRL